MKHFLIYGHGGCYNHGVEAITSCTIQYLREQEPGCHITLVSHFPEQDKEFGLCPDEFVTRNMEGTNNREVYQEALNKINADTIAIHVGGDNYCYNNWQRYALIHEETKRAGGESVFWGCSIDPAVMDAEMIGVLKEHDLILVRDPLTYEALDKRGLKNIVRVSDIAFGMECVETKLPFEEPYIVINISPLVYRKNSKVLAAFQRVLDYVLDETDYGIALLPHVTMPVDNDCEVLAALDSHSSSRVKMISDKLGARQYKYIISHGKLCVAARTHVSIAAYSTCVPTLVTGYSIKAQGIARDLNQSEYVIDVNEHQIEEKLLERFVKLLDNQEKIRQHLVECMPVYIAQTRNWEYLNRR